MVLSEDRPNARPRDMGSCGPWDDWGAGGRREICWARKLHGLVSWAGTSDDFKGFGLVVRE